MSNGFDSFFDLTYIDGEKVAQQAINNNSQYIGEVNKKMTLKLTVETVRDLPDIKAAGDGKTLIPQKLIMLNDGNKNQLVARYMGSWNFVEGKQYKIKFVVNKHSLNKQGTKQTHISKLNVEA